MLYLCRHGETKWSASGQHTGRTDISLTQQGKQEAVQLCKKVPHGVKIYCSPLKRAVETCGNLPYILEPLLMEWDYGAYEGLTSAEIQKKHPGWNLFVDGAPKGESPEDVARRADDFLKRVGKEDAVVFSHGHFLRVLAVRFLGRDVEWAKHLSLNTGSLSKLGFEKNEPAILLWNER